jgi:hypothetical protein
MYLHRREKLGYHSFGALSGEGGQKAEMTVCLTWIAQVKVSIGIAVTSIEHSVRPMVCQALITQIIWFENCVGLLGW